MRLLAIMGKSVGYSPYPLPFPELGKGAFLFKARNLRFLSHKVWDWSLKIHNVPSITEQNTR